MEKDKIIAEILKYKEENYVNIYNIITKGKWDLKKLRSLPNLTLHIIWRQLRNQES